jgi:hypothetical protein
MNGHILQMERTKHMKKTWKKDGFEICALKRSKWLESLKKNVVHACIMYMPYRKDKPKMNKDVHLWSTCITLSIKELSSTKQNKI